MLWVKALHIIALVCWFAGIFYLPRLFVYHDPVTLKYRTIWQDIVSETYQLHLIGYKLRPAIQSYALYDVIFKGLSEFAGVQSGQRSIINKIPGQVVR